MWDAPQLHACDVASKASEALLQGRDRECLDHFPCWLCFHHHHFAKDLSVSSLSCWLHSGFELAQARNGEHSCLLYFLRCNFCNAIKNLSTEALFQLCVSGQDFCNTSLGHCLCIHCFHGCH